MKKDILTQLLLESQSYRTFDDIEKLVERGSDLAAIPVQPLFMALRSTNKDQVAQVLPRLSQDQRQAMLDIDIWKKEELDPHASNWWLEVYAHCHDDKIRSDFAHSEDFLLMVKNQCMIQTFDAEEPEYPESDNYFLTEDNQLLIEYPEDFQYVQELKQLVKDLYTEMGVEAAYAHLFKMVADSYIIMEEDSFQRKKERLRDYGFLDYYDAMELEVIFTDLEKIKNYLTKKTGITGHIDDDMKNQTLHSSSLVSYFNGLDGIKDSLEKISDEKRRDYLQFTFVRLVNARIVSDDALKGGTVAMTRAGAKARQRLELGFAYVQDQIEGNPFEKVDFTDLYKIGNSLLEIPKRKLKSAISKSPFDNDSCEFFLGMWWTNFLDQAMNEPVKLKFDGSSAAVEINDMSKWKLWVQMSETFVTALPFIQKFWVIMQRILDAQELQDGFYLNYTLDTVDFETIMLSSLINFSGGHFDRSEAAKMGVTIDELKEFYKKFFKANGTEWILKGEQDKTLLPLLTEFSERFGLSTIPSFPEWLMQVMVEQMNGYEIFDMSEEDFKHVGGPLILVSAKN
jgi:hypothetical protein